MQQNMLYAEGREVSFRYVLDQRLTNFLNQNTDHLKQEAFYVPNTLRLEKNTLYNYLFGNNPNRSEFHSWRN
jgi:hypothetical protein